LSKPIGGNNHITTSSAPKHNANHRHQNAQVKIRLGPFCLWLAELVAETVARRWPARPVQQRLDALKIDKRDQNQGGVTNQPRCTHNPELAYLSAYTRAEPLKSSQGFTKRLQNKRAPKIHSDHDGMKIPSHSPGPP
jgi:hypothetical protein